MHPTAENIFRAIQSQPTGWVVTAGDLLGHGSRTNVDKTLARLCRKGAIRRIGWGLYERPRTHPVIGTLSPRAEQIAAALARREGIPLQMSGAAAANALGLTAQVPARPVYLSPNRSRRATGEGWTVEFRKVSTRRFVMPGTQVGNAFQAIVYLGEEGMTEVGIARLRNRLPTKERKQLLEHLANAPARVHRVIRQVCEPDAPIAIAA